MNQTNVQQEIKNPKTDSPNAKKDYDLVISQYITNHSESNLRSSKDEAKKICLNLGHFTMQIKPQNRKELNWNYNEQIANKLTLTNYYRSF